jgi:archaellum biogenesis protein FlaJ (TadC family)
MENANNILQAAFLILIGVMMVAALITSPRPFWSFVVKKDDPTIEPSNLLPFLSFLLGSIVFLLLFGLIVSEDFTIAAGFTAVSLIPVTGILFFSILVQPQDNDDKPHRN